MQAYWVIVKDVSRDKKRITLTVIGINKIPGKHLGTTAKPKIFISNGLKKFKCKKLYKACFFYNTSFCIKMGTQSPERKTPLSARHQRNN